VFFELRQYRIRPGKLDEWVRYMEETIIPFQASKGMVIVASFTDPEDPEHYVWIRRFEDEETRVRQYEAVYESERWKDEIRPRVAEMMIREEMKVTRLEPTALSVLH
jgi:hypothetical protein